MDNQPAMQTPTIKQNDINSRILGIGSDISQISRIEKLLQKSPEKFCNKIFTTAEIEYAYKRENLGLRAIASTLAKRFAAKEACLKAIGSGMVEGISWHDMEIINDSGSGKPSIHVSGGVHQRIMESLKSENSQDFAIHLSLSDDGDYAQAFVVVEVG